MASARFRHAWSSGGTSPRYFDRGGRFLAEYFYKNRCRLVGLERQGVGQEFVHHYARRKNIGAGIDRHGIDLLGREVRQAAQQLAGLQSGGFDSDDPGDAEINDFRRAIFGEDNVCRFYVAMDDLGFSIVSMLQPIAYLHQQFQLVHDRHGAALANDSRYRLTIQALHDKVGVSVLLPAFVNGDDVFVLQACGRA